MSKQLLFFTSCATSLFHFILSGDTKLEFSLLKKENTRDKQRNFMSLLYLLPLAVFIHSTKEKGSYGEAVFQEERKDIETQRWQEFSARKMLAFQRTIFHVFPSLLFSAPNFPRSSGVTVPTVSE